MANPQVMPVYVASAPSVQPVTLLGYLRRDTRHVSARAIHDTEWLTVHPAATIPAAIVAWRLGAGEASVLALAAEHPGTEAIVDDLAGRRCAASLNILVRGTLGIVLVAKRRGLVRKWRPPLN